MQGKDFNRFHTKKQMFEKRLHNYSKIFFEIIANVCENNDKSVIANTRGR